MFAIGGDNEDVTTLRGLGALHVSVVPLGETVEATGGCTAALGVGDKHPNIAVAGVACRITQRCH